MQVIKRRRECRCPNRSAGNAIHARMRSGITGVSTARCPWHQGSA
jgi:hypothetical protein